MDTEERPSREGLAANHDLFLDSIFEPVAMPRWLRGRRRTRRDKLGSERRGASCADPATALSIHNFQAGARHTCLEFGEPLAMLSRFRGGKVIYFRSFRDPDEALEAAGLQE